MKPSDDALLSLVRQRIGKAGIDYQTAERLLRDERPIRESIAFHCQQAVEKYLAPDLAAALQDTVPLTPFGVQIRYPGDFAELLPGQERSVFELARKTRQATLDRLGPITSAGR